MPDFDPTHAAGYGEIAAFTEAVMAESPEPKLTAAAVLNCALVACLNAYGSTATRVLLLDAYRQLPAAVVEAKRGLH